MRHVHTVMAALLALMTSACAASPGVGEPRLPGPPLTAESTSLEPGRPASSAPAPVTPDPVEAADGSSRRLPSDEPDFVPVPTPVPAPGPKPVRGIPTPPPTRAPSPDPVSPPTTPGGELDRSVGEAIADLIRRFNVEAGSVSVLDARSVTWGDGSVGCPAPGLSYSQAEVSGSLIVLRVGDTSYRYHAAGSLSPFYCETPQGPLEGSA